MGNRTPLYDAHLAANGKMVDFGGWDMPIHYGSQLDEHHQVRTDAGMFDVSHMTVVDISGTDATTYLRLLLANDVTRIEAGRALYSGMLNENGGVIDDLIVYRRVDDYRLVVNCATREKDLNWMEAQKGRFKVNIIERPELAMLAIQGPQARTRAASLLGGAKADAINNLSVFHFAEVDGWTIARTGYTGEDGVEIMLPGSDAAKLWNTLAAANVKPCGLGARDTLRLEAGMNLYGNDMDESISPLMCSMGWTLVFDNHEFIGKPALVAQQAKGHSVQVGLIMTEKGVLRGHQKVVTPNGDGEITSGTFSPTLGHAIALARVPAGTHGKVQVDIRGKLHEVEVVRPPFVRHGKSIFKAIQTGESK
jgi:aminomethyltransferase